MGSTRQGADGRSVPVARRLPCWFVPRQRVRFSTAARTMSTALLGDPQPGHCFGVAACRRQRFGRAGRRRPQWACPTCPGFPRRLPVPAPGRRAPCSLPPTVRWLGTHRRQFVADRQPSARSGVGDGRADLLVRRNLNSGRYAQSPSPWCHAPQQVTGLRGTRSIPCGRCCSAGSTAVLRLRGLLHLWAGQTTPPVDAVLVPAEAHQYPLVGVAARITSVSRIRRPPTG